MARRKNSVVDGMLLFFLSNDIYLFQFYLYMFIVYFRSRVSIHNHSTLDKKNKRLSFLLNFPREVPQSLPTREPHQSSRD